MILVYLKTGERIEIIKSLKLAEGYFLMLVKDETGVRTQVFSSDEIERIEGEAEGETKAA